MIATQNFDRLQYRVANYYLDKLRAAEAAYRYGHEHGDYALRLFDQEWPQIQQWQGWAAAHGVQSPEAARLCADYPLVSTEILALRQTPQNRIAWLQTGLESARWLKDKQSESAHLYLLAMAYNDLGEFTQAEANALNALTLAQAIDDRMYTALALTLLGQVGRLVGKFAAARDYFRQGLEIFRVLEDQRYIGKSLLGLGLVAWQTGQWEESQKLFTDALAIASEVGQELDICDALTDLAMPAYVLGDREGARALLDECIARCRAVGYNRVLASSFNTLGLWERGEGKLEQALAHFQEAISICRKSGTTWGVTAYLNNTSYTLIMLNRHSEALDYALKSLTMARATGARRAIVDDLSALAEIYFHLGQTDNARESLREAIKITIEINNPVAKLHMLITLLMVWEYMSDAEQATEWAGIIFSSPFSVAEEHLFIQPTCDRLQQELGLADFSAALERGKLRDVDGALHNALRALDTLFS